jgi:hypothetical protein
MDMGNIGSIARGFGNSINCYANRWATEGAARREHSRLFSDSMW